VPDSFPCDAEELGPGWRSIAVPSNWQLPHTEAIPHTEAAGGDRPIYTNVAYPWQEWPPHVPRAANPTALYRTTFGLPPGWCVGGSSSEEVGGGIGTGGPGWGGVLAAAERAILCFDAVDAACHAWLNGAYLGFSQDSRLPAEFDVTLSLRADADNVLAVQVLRWCDGSYLEDQDHWWLSGIHRDVWLYRKPAAHIADYEAALKLTAMSAGRSNNAPSGSSGSSGYVAELCVRVLVRTPPA